MELYGVDGKTKPYEALLRADLPYSEPIGEVARIPRLFYLIYVIIITPDLLLILNTL
jgi:hypothetical protein